MISRKIILDGLAFFQEPLPIIRWQIPDYTLLKIGF